MEMYVNKQWSRRLLALLLTVCLVCTLAPAAFAEGEEEKAVEEKPCSIKVLSTSDAKLKEDLDKIEILVDVYQLATIDTTGGKYAYTLVDPFKSLELKPVETGKTEEETTTPSKSYLNTNKILMQRIEAAREKAIDAGAPTTAPTAPFRPSAARCAQGLLKTLFRKPKRWPKTA